MTEISELSLARLADWLSGTCATVDGQTVERWIADGDGRAALIERLERARQLVRASVRENYAGVDNEDTVQRIHDGVIRRVRRGANGMSPAAAFVMARALPSATRATHPVPTRRWSRLIGVMASGLVAIAGIWGVTHFVRTGSDERAAPMQRYTTARGERATVQLSDGTRVILNVDSRLDVPQGFGTGNRTVQLEGEAAFVVSHASDAPFTIVAYDTRTTVLGTEFGVQAYRRDSAVRVAVRTGKVSVNGVALAAHDVGLFTATSAEVRHDQAVDAMLAFSRGTLVLTGRPLGEVVPDLERWYDVELRFGSPALATQRLEATLGPGSKTDLIQTLEFTLGARVVATGRVLTLYAR